MGIDFSSSSLPDRAGTVFLSCSYYKRIYINLTCFRVYLDEPARHELDELRDVSDRAHLAVRVGRAERALGRAVKLDDLGDLEETEGGGLGFNKSIFWRDTKDTVQWFYSKIWST